LLHNFITQVEPLRRELQRQFVEAHREADKTRKTAKDPVKLKERIAELEQEKEQVTSRIAVTKVGLYTKPETLNQKPYTRNPKT
jgi:hypothetical protein